jgi:hypothetical protein
MHRLGRENCAMQGSGLPDTQGYPRHLYRSKKHFSEAQDDAVVHTSLLPGLSILAEVRISQDITLRCLVPLGGCRGNWLHDGHSIAGMKFRIGYSFRSTLDWTSGVGGGKKWGNSTNHSEVRLSQDITLRFRLPIGKCRGNSLHGGPSINEI